MRWRAAVVAAAAVAVLAGVASESAAQAVGPNRGKLTFTGGLDFSNAYMFRGLRQDDTRLIVWPYVEGAAELHEDDDGLTRVSFHVGTWNSLHTGATGVQGASGRMWYESDIYGTLGLGFGPGVSVAATYTAYMSPNASFNTIKELAFKVTLDDAEAAGVTLRPHALVAFELDTLPGIRQADNGVNAGTYLEVGAAPGWIEPDFRIEFPVKLGLSLDDYYELAGIDHTFGFLSIAAMATVPIGGTTDYGSWNVHGGVEFLSLGNTPEAFNGGDQTKLVAAVGIGFSY